MYQRSDVVFRSAGIECAAWLYEPAGDGPHPVIVMAHGLGAVRTMRLDAFAERFCEAGYACLVFDYRFFGDSGGEPRQLLDIECELDDWRAALRFVRSQEQLDRQRIMLWGTSFSGGHVLKIASEDHNIRAVMSQCPFTDGLASTLALNPVSSLKVTVLSTLDLVGSLFGAKPIMVKTAGPAFSAGLMTAPDAEPGYLSLVAEGVSFCNEVAARFGLNILRYYPGRCAKKIHAPVLFCVCTQDSVAPAKPTLRYAKQAPQSEVFITDDGHFDIYVGDAFERVVSRQLEFLNKHTPLN